MPRTLVSVKNFNLFKHIPNLPSNEIAGCLQKVSTTMASEKQDYRSLGQWEGPCVPKGRGEGTESWAHARCNAEQCTHEIVRVRLYNAGLNCSPTTRRAVHRHPQAQHELVGALRTHLPACDAQRCGQCLVCGEYRTMRQEGHVAVCGITLSGERSQPTTTRDVTGFELECIPPCCSHLSEPCGETGEGCERCCWQQRLGPLS